MKLNFVVRSVYYYCLVDEELPLLDVSALDIWLIYLLIFVVFVGRLHDVPMAVKQILLKDLVLYLVNNRCLYRPTNNMQLFFVSFIHLQHCWTKYNVHTEPFSETAAPDALSDSSRSLSGSAGVFWKKKEKTLEILIFNWNKTKRKSLTEDSDLFFKIDFDRRCVSTFDGPSDESCENDLSGDLPE